MAAIKVNSKAAFLLVPHFIGKHPAIVDVLLVKKEKKETEYRVYELSEKNYKVLFSALPYCKNELLYLTAEGYPNLKNRVIAGLGGKVQEKIFDRSLIRHLHGLFETINTYNGLLSWYHKTEQSGKTKFRVSPCTFSKFRPALSFRVSKLKEELFIETTVRINGHSYPLSDFKRHHFLLESKNEYFILSYKDYQTLEWLTYSNVKQYAKSPADFARNILSILEKDYPVDRNGLFPTRKIEVMPANRVLLSELNGAFLMLTPQWVYDDIVVEDAWKEKQEIKINGEALCIMRNKEAEGAFVQLLSSLHPNFATQRNGYFYLSFAAAKEKQWFLKTYHKLLETGIELVGMDMLQHFRYSKDKIHTVATVISEADGRVLMEMRISFGTEQVPLIEIQKMLFAGQKLVLLKDNSLGILDEEWMQQFATLIKHGKIADNRITVARYLAFTEQQATDTQQLLKPLIKEQWWQKWKQWQTRDEILYPVPPAVKANLRPYQQKGFEWLTLLAEAGAGGCLADDMGLGKTLQTICYLAYYIHNNPSSVNIIISPSSLIYNWQEELQKFTPGISTFVYHGNNRNIEEVCNGKNRIIITSYGTLRADVGKVAETLFGVAVIDESHNIKNPAAQITTAVSSLNTQIRIALSGTPVVNNTFDLYSQINFALPGLFGTREFFRKEYATAIDRFHDKEKMNTLQKLTAPFILRRTKEQVATDLPEKTETILWCKMSDQQKGLYDNIREQISSDLFNDIKNNGLNKSKLQVLQGMLKLRQVCNSPLLLPEHEQHSVTQSVKTKVLLNELSNILKEHKALVFSQFSSMLKLLAADCDEAGIPYYYFDGQTPPAERAELVKAFQSGESEKALFLISLKAGNAGLTLTAADYVFLFDPWWNTAVEQQAIDRTHRIGQQKNVFAYKLICKNTIEEKIIQLQLRKKQLAEDLVNEDTAFIQSLTEEDISFLFS